MKKSTQNLIFSSFNMLLVFISLIISSLALYFALNDKQKITLFTKGVSDSKILSSSTNRTLYNYYISNDNLNIKKGYYEVTVNEPTSINFTVTDGNDKNITGNIENGKSNLPTKIYFDTQSNTSQIKLKYNTNNSNIILYRIDIMIY